METPPVLYRSPSKEWLGRHWKWAVPGAILATCLVFTAFFAVILGLLRSSQAYALAFDRARNAPAVMAVLGTPVGEGIFFVSGRITVSTGSRKANLAVPIRGPKGSATVYAAATEALGAWHLDRVAVSVKDTGERIDLSGTGSAESFNPEGDAAATPPKRTP